MALNNNKSPKGQGTNEPDPKKVAPDVDVDWMLAADSDIPTNQPTRQSPINRNSQSNDADDNLDWLKSLDLSPPVQTYSSAKPIKDLPEDTTTSFDDIDWLIVSDLKSKIDDSKITDKVDTSSVSSSSPSIPPTSIYSNDEFNDDLNLDGLDSLSLSDFSNLDPLESLDFGDIEDFDIDQLQDDIDDTEIKIRELSQFLDDDLDNDFVDPNLVPVSDEISRNQDWINNDDEKIAEHLGTSIIDDLSPELAEILSEEIEDSFDSPDATMLLSANAALNEIDNNDDGFWLAESLSPDSPIDTRGIHDSVEDVFTNEWSQPDDYPIDDAMWDMPLSIDSSADIDLSTPLENTIFDTLSPELITSELTSDIDWENVAIANTLNDEMIANDMDWDSDLISSDMDWEKDSQAILSTTQEVSEWDEITSSKPSEVSAIEQDLGVFLVDNFDLEQFDDHSSIETFPEQSTLLITTGINDIPVKDNALESESLKIIETKSLDDSINLTKDNSNAILHDSYEADIDDEILVNELLNDNISIQPFTDNDNTGINALLEKEQKLSNDIADLDFPIPSDKPISTSSFNLDMDSDFLDDFELDDPHSHFDDFSSDFIPSSLSTSLNPPNNPNIPNVSTSNVQKKPVSFQKDTENPNNPTPLQFLPPLPPKREPLKHSAPLPPKPPSPMARPPAIPRNTSPLPQKSPIPMDIPPQARKPRETSISQKPRPDGIASKLRDSIPDLNSIGLEEHDETNDWSELLDSANLSDSITTIISSGDLGKATVSPLRKDNIEVPVSPPVPPAVKQSPPQPAVPKTSNSLSKAQLAQVEFERIAASAYYSDDSQIEAKPTTAEKIKKFKTSVLTPVSLETIWQNYLKIPAIGLGLIGIAVIIFSIANEPIFNAGLKWGVFKNASGKNFSNADFSGANLENVDFSKANLVGAKMEKANLVGANLQEAKLDGVNFTDANLSKARLINASVVRSEFKNAQMNLADLSGANLERSNLVTAKMEGANLTGTKIGTQGKENATKFSPTVLLAWQIVNQPREGRNLSKQNLSGLNLNSANLRRANLSGARLNYTDLTRADLSGANLSSSQINGVNWNGAKLTGANVGGIVFDANKAPRTDDKTICPDRKNGPCKF